MKKYFLVAILATLLLTFLSYFIKNQNWINFLNRISISIGFVSFIISLYIIDYADDIREKLKQERNLEITKEYLEKDFLKNYEKNINAINKFQSSLDSINREAIVTKKNDIYHILITNKRLLQEYCLSDFELDKYIKTLENKKFNTVCTRSGNINYLKKQTNFLKQTSGVIYDKLNDKN